MSRKRKRNPSDRVPGTEPEGGRTGWRPRPGVVVVLCGVAVVVALACMVWANKTGARGARYGPKRPPGTLTFNKDIAPIVFEHCSGCHRPGQSAPFELLSYQDVKKRGRQIADMTSRRIMPPWMPEPGVVEFEGERLLSAEQIGLIQQWVEEGAVEGAGTELPPSPVWNEDWPLGIPDLVVRLAEPYGLPADGPDRYRNFVVTLPLTNRWYLKGLDFQPRSKAVHHAFFRFDRTQGSREADAADPGPGFGGIHLPRTVESAESQFLSWQPGKRASLSSDDLVSPIQGGSDLVVQLHLQPTGREEQVQPEVAFYFGAGPPTSIAAKIPLGSKEIDIPAGARDHVVKGSYTLPVDAEVNAILPHAHYLARAMSAYAVLPDGRKQWLLDIRNWDFDWQGDYRYARPISLPGNTRIDFEVHYDNSAENVRNPNRPPARVRYGADSADEMFEIWLQVVVKNREDSAALSESLRPIYLKDSIAFNQYLLGKDPNDARARSELGRVLMIAGRRVEAKAELEKAVRLRPDLDEPHYNLGLLFRLENRPPEAEQAFREALRLNPRNARARGNLGLVLAGSGRLEEAQKEFEAVLELDPEDSIARESLMMLRGRGESDPGGR